MTRSILTYAIGVIMVIAVSGYWGYLAWFRSDDLLDELKTRFLHSMLDKYRLWIMRIVAILWLVLGFYLVLLGVAGRIIFR